jgi:hypothetical protein
MAVDPRAIFGNRQQLTHRVAGASQVVHLLEQRDDAEVGACVRLQVGDREHVGRRLRHGDDVGAEARGIRRRRHPERVEHVAHLVAGFELEQLRARGLLQTFGQKCEPPRFRPAGVTSRADAGGDRIQRGAVPL